MISKHLHHARRGLVIGLEVLGLGVLLIFVVWLGLIVRLSQGPLNVDFLTKDIEKSFHRIQPNFEFSVGSTVLTWGGPGQHFIFEMKHVQIERPDRTPVLTVEKIGVQLSKKHLIFGEFVPRIIRIYGPALRIMRGDDGHFTLNVNENEQATPETAAVPAPEPEETTENKASQMEFIKALLAQMKDGGRADILGGLDEVSVSDAALFYEDKILNVQWRSGRSDVVIERLAGGLGVDTLISVEQDVKHAATIRGDFRYSWLTGKSNGTVAFANFNPALVAQQSEILKGLSGVDMPMKGTVTVALDPDFNPGYGRFVLGAETGTLSIASLYPEPMPVKTFYMQGAFNTPTGEVVLDQLHADIGGPKISAHGSIVQQPAGHVMTLQAALEDMPVDKLKTYWPASLTPDPRAWVTGHLSAGTATKATLELAMLSPHTCATTCTAPWKDFAPPQLQKVGGQIDFNGVKVDYFPPLMPVTKVNGKATYDEKSFNLDLTSGELGDMKVTGSKIAITDLDIQNATIHSKIDVAATLKGPLKTALKVLDSKPLQYPEKLGIHTPDVEGDAKIDVGFKFPLYSKLAIDDVKVTAKAQLDNVLLKGIVAGLPLAGGPMEVNLHTGSMDVKGKGTLGKMPVTFDWLKNFSGKDPVASKIVATLPLDATTLAGFGVPDDLKLTGVVPATVTYTVANNHTASLTFKGDMISSGFTLPVAGYEKKEGTPGTLDATLQFKNDQMSKITGIDLETDKAQLRGDVTFLTDGKTIKNAHFKQIKLGDTDISLNVDTHGSDGYDIKVTGAQFDASSFLNSDDAPNSDVAAAKKVMPLTVSMNVDRLMTGKNRGITKLRLFMRRNMWGRIDQLEEDGVAGGAPMTLRYLPADNGHKLNFETDNAGAALGAMGITNDVVGGKAIVSGQPDAQDTNGRNLRGTVVMTDFSLVNVPVLGKLLNALSLGGFFELLNGKGISFKKMRCDFTWTDRGQPNTAKNVRLLTLKNGQTSGASLGLTFEGTIDNWRNILDMNGTIIPVSDLNKLVSSIPLVGNIITGNGKGIFAATYTVKGEKAKPDVSVNPLSVLAPGILRNIFFGK